MRTGPRFRNVLAAPEGRSGNTLRTMRLLVVEDFAPIRTAVHQALREEGYAVDVAEDGDQAARMLALDEYDAVVLDIMLPGRDGLSLLEELRERERRDPVLLLTARDELDDRIRGLDLGADDYLVKPFAMDELLARVRALLRRGYDRRSPVLRFGHVEIRTTDHRVTVDGAPVELTAREYALLHYLAVRAGEVVTRTDIWEHLYDDTAETTSNVVDVYIGYLRKTLHVDGRPGLIQTRRGEGYLLAAPAEES